MSARGTSRRSRGSCLETAAIVLFAILLGAFAASTWMRHAEDGKETESLPVEGASTATPPIERSRIRVEVRNASGVPGDAARVTEFLRSSGFDVVDFGNAEVFDLPRTIVLDRIGAPERAREVAAVLKGVPIESRVDETLFLDVTVLVGPDARELVAASGDEPAEGWRGWLERARGILP